MRPQTSLAVIAFLVLSIGSLSARDSRYFSYIVRSTDDPVQFDLPANLYMKITNFSQASTSGVNTFGGILITKYGAEALVMTANSTAASSTNPVFVAGPCTVTVPPVQGATLFVTFLLGWN
jgi:hypothetical protein